MITDPAKKPKSDDATQILQVYCSNNQDAAVETAKAVLSPVLSSAVIAGQWAKNYGGGKLSLMGSVKALQDAADRVNKNDMTEVEARLSSQATALDTLFCELSRRAAANITEYPEAFERYMKLALKAQNQSRMTLETLANVKNPPIVYTKQANFANGPQQVNNGIDPAPAMKTETPPSKKLEVSHETSMDTGTTRNAIGKNTEMEAVGENHRA